MVSSHNGQAVGKGFFGYGLLLAVLGMAHLLIMLLVVVSDSRREAVDVGDGTVGYYAVAG